MTQTLIQQALLGSVAVGLIVSAVTLLRHRSLTFASGLLWVSMGALGLLGSLLLPVVNTIGLIVGVLPAAVFAGTASVLLGVIAFLLSMQVSHLERGLQNSVEWNGLCRVSPELSPTQGASILAVVPAYNEARSIGAVVSGLRGLGLPTLVVDDGSTDGTSSVARAAGGSVLELATNLGVGGALRAGLRYAQMQGFTGVLQCDGDGQHPTSSVAALLKQRTEQTDLLIGSRFTAGFSEVQGFARTAAIRLLATIASRASGARISDSTSGLRIIQQPLLGELADKLERHYLGDTFEVVVAAGKAGYTIVEMPIQMVERSYGTSTASAATAARMTLRALLTASLRFYRPFAPAASRTRCG